MTVYVATVTAMVLLSGSSTSKENIRDFLIGTLGAGVLMGVGALAISTCARSFDTPIVVDDGPLVDPTAPLILELGVTYLGGGSVALIS